MHLNITHQMKSFPSLLLLHGKKIKITIYYRVKTQVKDLNGEFLRYLWIKFPSSSKNTFYKQYLNLIPISLSQKSSYQRQKLILLLSIKMKLKPEINILIVEESKVFSSLVLDIAKELYLTTFLCTTGNEALALAEQQNIHLVCVNYYLSDMTAEEFCTKMRQLAQAKNTRILLITSEESPELLRRALLSVRNRYL